MLYAEIARRRADLDALDERDDIFSALLLAEDEDGQRLSDREVRDELVTLLLAGHETTATGLAWCFDLLLHDPAVRERARQGDERYLDAVVKESLRLRPVIPGVGRVVRGEPFRAERLRGPARRRDQPVDPRHAPPRGPVSRTPARSVPSGSSPTIRPIPTRGSRSAAARAAAWARASR